MDVARGGTGILSWIGGYLLVTLLRISLYWTPPCKRTNEQTTQMTMTTNELAASDRVEFLVADVRDKESVLKATRDITCCFHLVSIISLYGRRRLTHEVNVEGTRNMLDVR